MWTVLSQQMKYGDKETIAAFSDSDIMYEDLGNPKMSILPNG